MTEGLVREGSLTFSLSELSRLEGERLRGEREKEAGVRQARALADAEATRKNREREAEEARAREEARQKADREAREEATRHAAIQLAEVERARALAEGEHRALLAKEARQHELRLAAIASRGGAKTWRRVAMSSWALAAALGVCLFVELLVARPQATRRVVAAELETVAKSEESRRGRESLEQTRGVIDDLRQKLDEQARIAAVQGKNLDAALAELQHLKAPRGGIRTPSPTAPTAPTTHTGPFSNDCPPGSRDPLCGLGR
jgi:hypothetical protein